MGHTIRNLQALRGIACLMVVLYHLAGWEAADYGTTTPLISAFKWFGFAGVDVFFVLSGFIITHAHLHQLGQVRAIPKYLFKRVWRIYPTYWAAMILGGVCWAYLTNNSVMSPGWKGEWLHWMSLLPGDPANRYVAPAWTLTFEVMFYIAFAVLLLLPPRMGVALLAMWAVVIVAMASTSPANAYIGTALSPFVLEFLGGATVAWLIRRGVIGYGRSAIVGGVIYAGIAGVVAACLVSGTWSDAMNLQAVRVAVFGPAAVFVVYGMVAVERAGSHLSSRWLRVLGDASYSIYLTHCLTGRLAVLYGCYMPHGKWMHPIWAMLTLGACIAVGLALHFAVERPLMQLVSKSRSWREIQKPAFGTPSLLGRVARRVARLR